MATPFKLSEQWDKKNNRFQFFKRFIGGRNHVFTQDQAQSVAIGKALMEAWARLSSEGKGWSDEVIRSCYAKGGIVRQTSDKSSILIPNRATSGASEKSICAMDFTNANVVNINAPLPPKPSKSKMLYACIDLFLTDYKLNTKWSRYQKEVSDMNVYRHYQKDVPIAEIDADRLMAAVAHFKARPMSKHGAPLAVATVQSTIKAIKRFYDWCDMTDKWIAPRRFDRLFRVKYESLRTPLEVKKDSLGVKTFDLAELVELWRHATPRGRLYLGLALNTGETAMGLSNLLKLDVVREKDGWVIDRNRTKTGCRGVYPLWAEVQALLEVEMDRSASPSLLLTTTRQPLVHPTKNNTGRIDTVDRMWRQSMLCATRKTVRRMGFKIIRKTGASMIEKLTGSEKVAQLYLSHKPTTVAGKSYLSKDFTDLATALVKMHDHLQSMFAAGVVTSANTSDVEAA